MAALKATFVELNNLLTSFFTKPECYSSIYNREADFHVFELFALILQNERNKTKENRIIKLRYVALAWIRENDATQHINVDLENPRIHIREEQGNI